MFTVEREGTSRKGVMRGFGFLKIHPPPWRCADSVVQCVRFVLNEHKGGAIFLARHDDTPSETKSYKFLNRLKAITSSFGYTYKNPNQRNRLPRGRFTLLALRV